MVYCSSRRHSFVLWEPLNTFSFNFVLIWGFLYFTPFRTPPTPITLHVMIAYIVIYILSTLHIYIYFYTYASKYVQTTYGVAFSDMLIKGSVGIAAIKKNSGNTVDCVHSWFRLFLLVLFCRLLNDWSKGSLYFEELYAELFINENVFMTVL